jgi:hypothetical protein
LETVIVEDHSLAPTFIPHIKSVELIHSGNGTIVGSQWRVVREFRGQTITAIETVTRLQKDPFTISVSYDLKEMKWDEQKNSAETFTIIVQPTDNEDDAASPASCHIIWAFAFVPAGFFGTVAMALCRRCFLRAMLEHLEIEMQCCAEEAIRRAKNAKMNQELGTKAEEECPQISITS